MEVDKSAVSASHLLSSCNNFIRPIRIDARHKATPRKTKEEIKGDVKAFMCMWKRDLLDEHFLEDRLVEYIEREIDRAVHTERHA